MRGGGGKTSKVKKKPNSFGRAKVISEGSFVEVVVSMPGSQAGKARARQIRDTMNELLAVREKIRKASPTRSKRSHTRRR